MRIWACPCAVITESPNPR